MKSDESHKLRADLINTDRKLIARSAFLSIFCCLCPLLVLGQQAQPLVTINDIVGAVGLRIRDSNNAQKRFRIATIIVSKDSLLNEDAMAFYSFFAKRAEETREVLTHMGFVKETGKPFAISTGGRASLDALLVRGRSGSHSKQH